MGDQAPNDNLRRFGGKHPILVREVTAMRVVARDMPDSVRALSLELALRSGRYDEVADGLSGWADADEGDATATRNRQLAAGRSVPVESSRGVGLRKDSHVLVVQHSTRDGKYEVCRSAA